MGKYSKHIALPALALMMLSGVANAENILLFLIAKRE